tara:strand:+ start:429 stop:1019 length:591 start_codon:yes stop_codon:yes gene_type:complete
MPTLVHHVRATTLSASRAPPSNRVARRRSRATARAVAVARSEASHQASEASKSDARPPWRGRVAASLAALTLTLGPQTASAIDLVIADPSVKQYMDSRDDAMRMKCEGGMMDCDGDRREYARAQSENFILRNSRDVPTPPTCKVEEACTSDIIGAAIAGLNGFTTSEKLEKLGRDANAVNSTANMFGGAEATRNDE